MSTFSHLKSNTFLSLLVYFYSHVSIFFLDRDLVKIRNAYIHTHTYIQIHTYVSLNVIVNLQGISKNVGVVPDK